MAFYGDGKHNEDMEYMEAYEPAFYVNIPCLNDEGRPGEAFINAGIFDTKEEAIKFAMKYFGADNEGKISLIIQS